MRHSSNLNLALYDSTDKMSITGASDSLNHNMEIIDDEISKIKYGEISVTSFTSSPSSAEIGSTQNVTLSWTTNKTPSVQKIDGTAVSGNSTTKSGISSNTTFTYYAEGLNNNATKTASITFLPKLYYGNASSPASIDSSFVLSLTGVLSASRAKRFTLTAGNGEYIWFATPTRYGTPAFKVGGFTGGFSLVATIEHTNESGYAENYYVYRSDNKNLGITEISVE